eukprot:m.12137 g.12137  ORF g.12137 m.12137 type:complete len:254 (+) comp9461_c0_seq1:283-1044(+)
MKRKMEEGAPPSYEQACLHSQGTSSADTVPPEDVSDVKDEFLCPYAGCGEQVNHSATCALSRPYYSSAMILYINNSDRQLAARTEFIQVNEKRYQATLLDVRTWVEKNRTSVNGMVTHVVKSNDTLPGLALRYGVNMGTIKKVNKLFGTDIQAYRSLQIPSCSGANPGFSANPSCRALTQIVRDAITDKLAKTAKISIDEAAVLLQLTSFDYEKALAEHNAGCELERRMSQNGSRDQSFADFLARTKVVQTTT